MAETGTGDLAGKVALITGGSSGIGRAIALKFAEEGAVVLVADIRDDPREGGQPTHDVIDAAGGDAHFLRLDVTDSDAVQKVVGEAIDRHGLDILVCAAGNIGPTGDFVDIAPEALDAHFAVNFRGLFCCNQAAIRFFVEKRAGKIVNVASNLGFVGVHGMAAYCSMKGAVVNLTRSLAVEYGQYGINVNALCPGMTVTELNAGLRSDPEMLQAFERMTPLRMGESGSFAAEPSDMAEAALFLASERSRFATGTCFVVDGGWTAH